MQSEEKVEILTEADVAATLARLWLIENERRDLVKDVQAQIEALQDQARTMTVDLDAEINVLEARIKEAVLKQGRSVASITGYKAQYNRGRTAWNTDRLDGLALLVPEINDCRKVGEPYVTILRK